MTPVAGPVDVLIKRFVMALDNIKTLFLNKKKLDKANEKSLKKEFAARAGTL